MSFGRRPLAPGDAGEWAELLAAIQQADSSDDHSSEQDLREASGRVGFTVARTWISYRKQLA